MRFLEVLRSRGGKPLNFEEVGERAAELCRRFGIDLLYIFGSYAGKTADKLSDVDVAYLAKGKVDELKLIAELQEIFEDEAIDLVDLERAPLPLVHRILKEGKCLYASSPRRRVDFETRSEALYWDSMWLREEYFKKMVERIENGTFGR
jgi:predicted nucleotidyltransferase